MMAKSLNEAFEELKKEAALKKQKKKPVFQFPKEKRLAYYSGWHKDDEPMDKSVFVEKQKKLV